jgi:hypothetical protein
MHQDRRGFRVREAITDQNIHINEWIFRSFTLPLYQHEARSWINIMRFYHGDMWMVTSLKLNGDHYSFYSRVLEFTSGSGDRLLYWLRFSMVF